MKYWWEKLEPVHKDEGLQSRTLTYVRKRFGQWQYAVVITDDGGTLHHAVVLHDGKIEIIEG